MSSPRLVPVFRSLSQEEASVVCASLNAAGISAVLFNHATSTLPWHVGLASPHTVEVPDGEYDEAVALLNEWHGAGNLDDDGGEPASTVPASAAATGADFAAPSAQRSRAPLRRRAWRGLCTLILWWFVVALIGLFALSGVMNIAFLIGEALDDEPEGPRIYYRIE
jgi:hypothetical protein